MKIIQLNFWTGRFLNEAVEFFQDQQPDIICFQEMPNQAVGRSDGGQDNPIDELKSRLNMEAVYMPMWEFWDESTSQAYNIGLLILSKHPIISSQIDFFHKNLIRYKEKPGRGKWEFPGALLSARIDVGGKIFQVGTTHYLWSLFPEETEEQVEAGRKLVKRLDTFDNLILAGDFNLTDQTQVYKMIVEAGFTDDRPENTTTTIHPTNHVVGDMDIAVDFIFHKGNNHTKVSSEIPMVGVSDHLPVVVEYAPK